MRLTVNRVVANGLADLLDNPLPAHILGIPRVRDDPAEFAVVVVDFPAVDSSADADVLRARSVEVEGGDGMETHDVGVIGRKQALLPCVVEVAAVRNGGFFARVPGVVLLQRQCVRECTDCTGDEYAQVPARAARCLPYREHGRRVRFSIHSPRWLSK